MAWAGRPPGRRAGCSREGGTGLPHPNVEPPLPSCFGESCFTVGEETGEDGFDTAL